jgi:single-strand DNA-binding protein
VQFLGGRDDAPMGGGANNGFAPHSDVPADTSDFAPQPVGARNNAPADDDIPF